MNVLQNGAEFRAFFAGTVEFIQRITAGHHAVARRVCAVAESPADMAAVQRFSFQHIRADFRIGQHHAADAGDQPYRQMCSAINANANANAHTNQIPIAHRIVQNIWAMGLRWCSLYALELNIFNPLDEPPAEKNLNLAAITDMIIPEKCSIINHEL